MPPAPSPSNPSASASPRKSQSSAAVKKLLPKRDKDLPTGGGDIRAFFSQGSAGGPSASGTAVNGRGTGREPITIEDSDEEDVKPKKPSAAPKPTTSKHFPPPIAASSSKAIIVESSPDPTPPPTKSKPKPSQPPSAKMPAVKRKLVKGESGSEDDFKPIAKRQSVGGPRASAKKPNYLESSDEEEEEEEIKPRAKSSTATTNGKVTKREPSPMDVDDESDDDDFDLDDDEDIPKKAAAKKPPAKKTTLQKPAPTPKKSPAKKPTPKPAAKKLENDEGEEKPKKPAINFRAMAAARAAGPKNPGSKEVPEGAPECLAGLTFVFTGELESLGREESQELAKRYGGKVTTAPSKKTSYVVVGENAGPSKLKKIQELGLETLNEDEFLELIRSRKGGELDDKAIKALEKEKKKIEDQAREMERREKEDEMLKKRKTAALKDTGVAAKKPIPVSAQLWTTKYAPQNLKEICGNKTAVERLGTWLQEWDNSYKSGFKRPGKDGMGIYRAVLISGPPGIGKTTSAHLMAKQAGYNPIELNASDARSKKLVENYTNIDNTSLDGFFQGTGVKSTTVVGDIKVDSRTCLIMDEVDGMSAGDRGGVGALNGLIKKTRIPMILICNDRTLQKMKPLMSTTFNMTFRRPGPNEVRSRIMSIMFKEKMKVPANVLDELVKGANSDIRQVLNMLSTYKLSRQEMDFDQGKELLKINEKNSILTPFTIIEKLAGPYAFSRTHRDSLNEKAELYFHDFSFVPLFMQEHYAKTEPASASKYEGPEKTLKQLELLSKAADSISDGDLIDRMIHGSEQHWSLLPVHAFASAVRPAYFIYGPTRQTGSGFGSWGPSFPQWLGQNSKEGKLRRQLTDIQIRMRLKVSGSKQEIRETYMPMLAAKIVNPLLGKKGQEHIDETIEVMDEYYLGKDDWDAFVELGVDDMKDDIVLKKIETSTKSAFTRQYNKSDHPIAFHKGDMFAASKKKIADLGPTPDNEDVFEEDEPVPDEASDKEDARSDDEVNDVAKDKLIKAVKPKGQKGKVADKGKKK